MADMKFSCSHCGQDIECDELWSGHEIQCPTCQGQLVVPPKPDAPPHAHLASAKANQPRLSIGLSRDRALRRAAAAAAPDGDAATAVESSQTPKEGQPDEVGGHRRRGDRPGRGRYFGYGYFSQWQAKRRRGSQAASEAAAQQAASAAAAEAAPLRRRPGKGNARPPPVWTLDVDKATIPNSRVTGVISGTNFVADTAMCTVQVLRLFQGASALAGREILVYLHLNPGQSPTGHTWTVSQDMRDRSVPQVVKRWKTNPRFAPQSRPTPRATR